MRTGLYMLARFAIPGFPEAAKHAMPVLVSVALFSGIYGAVAALGQYNLRRMVGFLIVSQSGIMLTGLVFGDAHAVSGTLLYWLGFAVATTGLVLMVGAITARTRESDMRKFGGIVGRVPNLSACFFLFGLATIAIPGTVAFAAEDMLVHGALESHPLLTLVMIVAMVLNAITVVRAFAMTFLGNRNISGQLAGTIEDLLPRERITAVALLIALISAGVYPQALIKMQEAAADHIAFIEHEPKDE
jgi:NADH-quinone oxidoreductase subunit M